VLGGDVATAAAKLASLSDADFNRITNALALAIVKRSGLDVAAKATTGEGEGMDTKKWFQSKGILGGIAAVGALIGPIFGLDLGTTNVNDTAVAINDLIAAIGAIVAIYGRMTAKTTIKA
jgi:hypothetical protein